MSPDNGPPDGNFAAYIEALNRTSRPGATQGGAQGTSATTVPASPQAKNLKTALAARLQERLGPSARQEMPEIIAALRSEFAPLLRFVIIAFILLSIASTFGSPYSTMARIAALVIGAYVIRRAIRRTTALRASLRERMNETPH